MLKNLKKKTLSVSTSEPELPTGVKNLSAEILASMLLQTPISVARPLPTLSDRQDFKTLKVGDRVFVKLRFNRYHNCRVKECGQKNQLRFLTALAYIATSEQTLKIRISTFEETSAVETMIRGCEAGGFEVAFSGVIEIFNNMYQLAHCRIHPSPSNSAYSVYDAFEGVPRTKLPSILPELTRQPALLIAAKHCLYNELDVKDDSDFREVYQQIKGVYINELDPALSLIKEVHTGTLDTPSNEKGAAAAKSDLEKLAILSVIRQSQRQLLGETYKVESLAIDLDHMANAINSMDITPTEEQQKIALAILASFDGKYNQPLIATEHLIYGDVGYGKTAVMALIVYCLLAGKKNVLIMAPSQNLAIQTHAVLTKWFSAFKHKIHLCTMMTDITLGELGTDGACVVGTSALLHRDSDTFVPFAICIDEEQRFGVQQRDQFRCQGAHYIAVTATPIPRTAANTLLDNMHTHWLTKCFIEKSFTGELFVEAHGRHQLYQKLKHAIANDEQVLFITPLTADSSNEKFEDFNSCENLYQKLSTHFGDGTFRYMHGKRKVTDNERALEDMKSGAKGLVATTAIEVGIDLPSLRHLIVMHPERFGLTQLHQLRGRLVRQGGIGHVSLYSPNRLTPEQTERLEFFLSNTNGQAISEYDSKRRGIGDLFGGTAQHGNTQSSFIRHLALSYEALEEIYGATQC